MFRHQGKSRTFKHNLQIAVVLSFVAGMVNVTGFLAFKQLTSNVTGHFALFINDLADGKIGKGGIYFIYIFSFFLGSFFSSLLIEKLRENRRLNVFVLPTLIECLILLYIAVFSNFRDFHYPDLVVSLMLFAMGLQNSFVTKISNAVVRTTHLTGLFTDLGIDVSQLFFRRSYPYQEKIKANIKLRLYIITFFFAGGFLAGFLFSEFHLELNTLFVPAGILLISLFYDDFRYRLILASRKFRS